MRTAGIFKTTAGFSAVTAGESRLALGPPALDQALGGGLCLQRLHEIVPEGVFQLGSAAGFALALAARGGGTIVWIQQGLAALEGGAPYGPGGALFGIAPARLLIVQVATPKDALWAMEEGLRCAGIAAVIGELSGAGEAADLTATRRLNLVLQERENASLGLLLRHQPLAATSACATRWQVRAAPGRGDGLGGIGRTAFALSLVKNQRGPCGDWQLEWDNDEQCFRAALPVAVAAPAANRPYRAA
jgi:protein ImuA